MSAQMTTLTKDQQTRFDQMQKATERAALFQEKMTILQMENSVQMAALQAMKGAFDKIRG